MEKMFVSPENTANDTLESVFRDFEPVESKAATASYRCKLYRVHLEQGAASQFRAVHSGTKTGSDQANA